MARIVPSRPPMIRLQENRETMTVMGWRPTRLETTLGVMKKLSIFGTITKMQVTTRGKSHAGEEGIHVPVPPWTLAMMRAGTQQQRMPT